MRPVLFHIGSLAVNSYGVFIAVAAILAGFALRSELRRRCGRGEAAFALVLAAILGGFLGARLYFLAEHPSALGSLDSLSGAGFTWYGGVIGGAAAVLLVARRRGLPIPALVGAAAPALALGYGLGRIACQFAGDGTYGTASNLPWAMSYPHGELPTKVRVHPTPMYETLASLLIFTLLWRLRRRMPPIELFGLYLVLAGIERFLIEFIRRNEHVWLGLSQPQLFAAALAIVGAVVLGAGAARAGRLMPEATQPAA